jgi:chromosomal replication initiator protein
MNRPSNGQSAGHDSFFGGVLRALQKRMRREQFETWFHGFRLRSCGDDVAEFTVPSVFVRDWLLKNYQEDILAAVETAAADGTRRRVVITLDDERRVRPVAPRPRDLVETETEAEASGETVAESSAMAGEATASDEIAADEIAAEWANHAVSGVARNGSPSTSGASASPFAGFRTSSSSTRDPYLTKLNKDYIFDQFVVGQCNRLAYAACNGIGEHPGRNYNPLYIHGNVGLGKTHLLQATCHSILRRQRDARVLYLSCEDFTNRFIQAIQAKRVDEFRQLHRNVDILVIDDVQFLANKERTQDEFFHTFNALHSAGRQIVISSDRPPPEIPTIEERLVSRFRWGLVAEMQKPDLETRVQIVKRKGRVRGVEFQEDVAQFIAERIDSNIRELEGAVVKVVGIAALVDREIDVELAQEALQGVRLRPKRNQVSLPDIMQLITREFSISPKELIGKRRTQAVSLPRQIGMYLSRESTEHSLEEIGRFFGNRDHTTVLYAVKKIRDRSKDDRMFRELLQSLNEQLFQDGLNDKRFS